jgi:hypothetical protein
MKLIATLAFVLVSSTAFAEKTIGVDGAVALPTGDWGDAVGFGIGALARFEMPINAKLVFTARAGYIQHMEKEDGAPTVGEIPLLAGMRYAFQEKVYGAAELGFVNYRMSLDVDGQSMSDSDTNLGMSLGAGYRSGKLDLRGGLYFPDVDHASDAMGVMATIGYDISTL